MAILDDGCYLFLGSGWLLAVDGKSCYSFQRGLLVLILTTVLVVKLAGRDGLVTDS